MYYHPDTNGNLITNQRKNQISKRIAEMKHVLHSLLNIRYLCYRDVIVLHRYSRINRNTNISFSNIPSVANNNLILIIMIFFFFFPENGFWVVELLRSLQMISQKTGDQPLLKAFFAILHIFWVMIQKNVNVKISKFFKLGT